MSETVAVSLTFWMGVFLTNALKLPLRQNITNQFATLCPQPKFSCGMFTIGPCIELELETGYKSPLWCPPPTSGPWQYFLGPKVLSGFALNEIKGSDVLVTVPSTTSAASDPKIPKHGPQANQRSQGFRPITD